MQILKEFLQISRTSDYENGLIILEKMIGQAQDAYIKRNSGNPVGQFDDTLDLEEQIGVAISRLEAARRAIGLANKIKDPVQKKQNQSRVTKNFNLLKATVDQIWRKLDQQNKEGDKFGKFSDQERDRWNDFKSAARDSKRNEYKTNREIVTGDPMDSSDENPFGNSFTRSAKNLWNRFSKRPKTNESVMMRHEDNKKSKVANWGAKAAMHKNDDPNDNPFDSKTKKLVKKGVKNVKKLVKK